MEPFSLLYQVCHSPNVQQQIAAGVHRVETALGLVAPTSRKAPHHVSAARCDAYVGPKRATAEPRPQAGMPSLMQLRAAGFRDAREYQASLASGHRMLGQERAMRGEGEASTRSDRRELPSSLQHALDLEARTKLTQHQCEASRRRQQRQHVNGGVEGQ